MVVSHFQYSVNCLNKDKCLPPLRPHPNVSVLLLVELIYLQLNVGWWGLLCNAKLPLVYVCSVGTLYGIQCVFSRVAHCIIVRN